MINRSDKLPVVQQCALLGLSRSSVYYTPQPVSESDLALMRRIDEPHLHHPFAGARMLRDLLGQDGLKVGRRHVSTLMKKMGIEALYRRPNTSRKPPRNPGFPYLLRGLEITEANHVWAMDISYIPMRKGFVYLAAVLDWATRGVLSWRLSNSLTTDFCIEAVEAAIQRHGTPEIFNTDQGSQFTSQEFVELIQGHGIRMSMDGKGRWVDNVFVERLWKSVKYEEVYLHAYETVAEAREGWRRYFKFYNERRPHSSLDGKTPDRVYFASLPIQTAA
jgi:putative transposase